MIIGVPKETKTREYRVGMTPAGVRQLLKRAHVVRIEKGAGEGSGIRDEHYAQAGAIIVGIADVSGGYLNAIIGLNSSGNTVTLSAAGGTGGNGGALHGTGTNGNGGKGGPSGRILCWYLGDGTLHTAGIVDGTAGSGTTGGPGGAATVSI